MPQVHTVPRKAEESVIPQALVVRIADRLKVLGQPVRLRLLEQLIERPSTPQELSDVLGLSQQNVSKHLLSLHWAGIVSRRPEGTNVIYALVDENVIAVIRLTLESVTQHLRALSELASGATAVSAEDGVRDSDE